MNESRMVVALGTVNVDVRLHSDRWPHDGDVVDLRVSGGGRAANVCHAARLLGVPARVVGRLGGDDFGAAVIADVVRLGVDVRYLRRVSGAATGVALIRVDPDGSKSMSFSPQANASWHADDVRDVRAAIADAPAGSVLVTDCAPPATVLGAALLAARERGSTVIVDPTSPERLTPEMWRCIDYVTPNASEASRLVGAEIRSVADAFHAADVLVRRGAPRVAIKLGPAGTVVVSQHARLHVRPPQVRAVDTTGAGDAFAAALAAAVIESRPLSDAVSFATAAAAVATTRAGAQASYPTRDEVEAIMAQTSA